MFRRFSYVSLFLLSWTGESLVAQASDFHGPVAGFVYSHASRTIRPLLGVAGAAQVGSPVLDNVDFASVAPGGKWALIAKDGRTELWKGLADLSPMPSPADGLIDAVDRVVWNTGGSVAILYSSTANQLQRVRLTDQGATADFPLDVSHWGTLSALTIDAAGRQIAFGAAGSGIYLWQAGQSPVPLLSMTQPAAAAFDATGRRLYAVDLDQQQISEFDSGGSVVAFASLARPDAPAVAAAGLAVSGDGRYLMLADGAAQAVQIYNTDSGSLTNTIPLSFVPSRFETLSAAPTFLLNGDRSNEWLLILDGGRTPGISFVPAGQEVVQ